MLRETTPFPERDRISALADACAGEDPVALFAAIDACARPVLGQTLCTVNRLDIERLALVRLYSSDPRSYPPGGGKDKRGTDWGRHVLLERRIFVGEGIEAIRQSFDDHRAIEALGLKSVINVPLVARGVCLGTMNFLMPAAEVGADKIACARLSGLLALPGMMALP
ncbi:MAG: GAF domain-containing protein [Bordetella sp.]|uniref:GAF domain-containing protein n=1 Tax=Bordetella sp. TaxID=28081 RepID=UPI003F7C6839